MSLRERIRDTQDWRSQVEDVPEWDTKVEVRSLSLGDVTRLLASEKPDITADLVVAGCYDPESGERVFDEGDEEWLLAKDGAALRRLSGVVVTLSALGRKAVDEAGKGS